MAENKYKFNQDSLRYEKIKLSFKTRMAGNIPFLLITLFIASIIVLHGHKFLQSPKLKSLHNNKTYLEMQLGFLQSEVLQLEETISDISYNDDHIFRTYFEVGSLSPTIREAGFGGSEKNYFVNARAYSHLLQDINTSLEILAKKAYVQSISFDEIIEMAKTKEKRLAARPAIQPVSIAELTRIGSSFGMRMHPILKEIRMHEGIDLTCPRGTRVFSSADGIVLESGYSPGGFGIRVFIDHGFGYQTIYGHLEKVMVQKGDTVKRGDVIGLVGNTGLSMRPHLHYEVVANGKKVNPVNYYANDLTAEEFEKMIHLLSNADPDFDIN